MKSRSLGLVALSIALACFGFDTVYARGPGGGGGRKGGSSGRSSSGHTGGAVGGNVHGNGNAQGNDGAHVNGGEHAGSNKGDGRNNSSNSNRTPTNNNPRMSHGPQPPMQNGNHQPRPPQSNQGPQGQPNHANGSTHNDQHGNRDPNNRGANDGGRYQQGYRGTNHPQDGHNGNYRPSQANHSFYQGHWNNNGGQAGPQNAAGYRQGAGYGINGYGFGQNGIGQNGIGLGAYGGNNALGGYGYGGGSGTSGLGSLLQIGLALAGSGGGGNSGIGGLGLGGLGGGQYGNYGGYGLLGGYPLGWGLGGGGLGSLAYSSGYLPYSNPYYASNMAGYNYAQPLSTMVAVTQNSTASQYFDAALAQFKAGDYTTALISVDNAIQQNPSDTVLHEFRALDLFALQNYQSAAATIHSVIAVGPGWDWKTLRSLYSDGDVYEAQLRSLEKAVAANPEQADTRFLLAYHYMTTGHSAAASKQLVEVVRLAPTDRLAADLLKMNQIGQEPQGTQPGTPIEPNAVASQPVAAPNPIDPAALIGTWHAQRADGSKFDLQLGADKTFTWNVNQQGQEQSLTGTFEVEKGLLALESPQAGGMVAQVSQSGNDQFTFKLLGAPQDDLGLAFTR